MRQCMCSQVLGLCPSAVSGSRHRPPDAQCEGTVFTALDVRTLLILLRSPEPIVVVTAIEALARFADLCGSRPPPSGLR